MLQNGDNRSQLYIQFAIRAILYSQIFYMYFLHESDCLIREQHNISVLRDGKSSVGLEPKIPKEPQLLYFGAGNFEQFRFQSIQVPIPKL